MPDPAFALEARDLRHTFPGPTEVLRGVSLRLRPGRVLAVLGPSGSGKSTLLHLLGGLEAPTGGEVVWAGRSLAGQGVEALARRRASEVGFVFQHHYLLEDLTVLENVGVPSLIAGRPDEARARELVERVGLARRSGQFPRTLSGGERQRASLARALQTRPSLVLADEPTGSLDRVNAEMVFEMLVELAREQRAAVVVVTHDHGLADRADELLHLSDGRVLEGVPG